jgi:hypothetical protein
MFPYQTVDKLLRHSDTSGAVSAFRVVRDGGAPLLWEPWGPYNRAFRIGRNLYKHVLGTSVTFEETNFDLGLRLSWTLSTCERFGLVRRCTLENLGSGAAQVEYVDGFHMLLPPGVGQRSFADFSYLAAGYMRHEALPDVAMGIYALNSAMNDTPTPLESLRSTCAWSIGLEKPVIALSEGQLRAFRSGGTVTQERELRGDFGSFLLAGTMDLQAGQTQTWFTVVDTGLDQAALVLRRRQLADPAGLEAELRAAVDADRGDLRRRIAAADGLQQTADEAATVHHFTSVLFNCMRGGTLLDSYRFPRYDLAVFLQAHNAPLAKRYAEWTAAFPETLTLDELGAAAEATGDRQLIRICGTYLPLIYSRRHGDPSRPWNQFSIRLKDNDGRPIYGYEGNWRDIFQNWEALAQSQPGWLEPMLAVFLNGSTADGYNPYRITRNGGVEWEVGPEDAWGHFGYWGDHQIVYLLRLLESRERFHPGALASNLNSREYAYADVPYRIAGIDAILADPRDTITVDRARHLRLMAAAESVGADGKLVTDEDGSVRLVSLAEKLLVPVLVKLTNYVPDGGTWLNTQRPEWNDANNALAGSGLSMVTVNHARRYLRFCEGLFAGPGSVELTAPVSKLLDSLTRIYRAAPAGFDDTTRYEFIVAAGRAGEAHRTAVYADAFGSTAEVSRAAVRDLIAAALAVLEPALEASKREDGLYQAYNLLAVEDGRARVAHLYPMLEGQVAALSSGLLDSTEEVAVLRALRASDLFTAEQHSYLLYPDLVLPSLLAINTLASAPPLDNPEIFVRDVEGNWHFHADLRNAADLAEKLKQIGADDRVREAILGLWERTFRHHEFTGRSRTFFMFEGLGSIYWHMVAKLLLAAQEGFLSAVATSELPGGASESAIHALAERYDDIRDGLGFRKSAETFGAFPCDPYSHTPAHRGAQQPGMTGLVKEEVLARWGEIGVLVEDGCLRFEPRLLHASEFSSGPQRFEYVDLLGRDAAWELPAGSLAFTYCGTPICYRLADVPSIEVERPSGPIESVAGNRLPAAVSRSVFARDGSIARLTVGVSRGLLRP